MDRGFLRFVGTLWETGEFEPGIGWETERIARRPVINSDYHIQLLNADGDAIVQAGIELRSDLCKTVGRIERSSAKVVGYLPLRTGGTSVALCQGQRVLYNTELAVSRPHLSTVDIVHNSSGTIELAWHAEHDRPLWFNVLFVDAKRRAIPVAQNLTETHFSLNTSELPGGLGCSMALLATDGLRSTMIQSDPFDLPDKPPRVVIVIPSEDEKLAPDQPFSLLGSSFDLAGQSLSDEHLVWYVDDRLVSRGKRLALSPPLEPGEHIVRLEYMKENNIAQSTARIFVTKRSFELERWRCLSSNEYEREA